MLFINVHSTAYIYATLSVQFPVWWFGRGGQASHCPLDSSSQSKSSATPEQSKAYF